MDEILCRLCGYPCQIRRSKNNKDFYGCTNYPACKGDTPFISFRDGRCDICGGSISKGDPITKTNYDHWTCDVTPASIQQTQVQLQDVGYTVNIPSKFVIDSEDYIPPTPEQIAIRKAYIGSNEHIMVSAKAGSGKTTLLEWILTTTVGKNNSPNWLPKPPWDRQRILFTAFNVSIKNELKARVDRSRVGAHVKTLNGLGFTFCKKTYGESNLYGGSSDKATRKVSDITKKLLADKELDPDLEKDLKSAIVELVPLIKNLVAQPSEYEAILDKYDIELEFDERYNDLFLSLVDQVLYEDARMAVTGDRAVDFDDMVWLPAVVKAAEYWRQRPRYLELLKTPQPLKYDVVFVDETQDLNRAQTILCLLAAGMRVDERRRLTTHGRIIAVGDPNQSIYAFRGSDSESMAKLFKTLDRSSRGCRKMNLSVSFRCPKKVIKLAQEILDLPQSETIHAASFAPPGEILHKKEGDVLEGLDRSDLGLINGHMNTMVLSRRNAPLVSFAYRILQRGLPAVIRGRDVANGMMKYIDNVNPDGNEDLRIFFGSLRSNILKAIQNYADRKDMEFDEALEANHALLDKASTMLNIAGFPSVVQENTVTAMKTALYKLFSKECGSCGTLNDSERESCQKCRADLEDLDYILLSTVHKSKGLEALNILLIDLENITGEPIWVQDLDDDHESRQQEINLYYVAVTRTKFDLGVKKSGILTYVEQEKEAEDGYDTLTLLALKAGIDLEELEDD